MGQRQLLTALVMFSVFVLAIISFSIGYAVDNDASVSLGDDSEITSLNVTVKEKTSTLKEQSNSSSIAFFESDIGEGDQTTRTGGQFKVGLGNLLGVTKDVLSVGYTKIFGSGGGFGFVLVAFSSLMVYIAFLYIWKTWKGGNPD